MLLSARAIVFAFAVFMATHLLRERKRGALGAAGPAAAALLLLAATLGADAIAGAEPRSGAHVSIAARGAWALRAVAPALWLDAALALVPTSSIWHARLRGAWRSVLLPAALVIGGLVAGSDLVLGFDAGEGLMTAGPGWPIYVAAVVGAAVAALVVLWLARSDIDRPFVGILLVGTVFLGMSLFGVLTALGSPRLAAWATVAVGLDLLLLGAAVTALDAFDAGEQRAQRVLREAWIALLPASLVGAQIAWVLAVSNIGWTGVAMLFGAIATVIVTPTLLLERAAAPNVDVRPIPVATSTRGGGIQAGSVRSTPSATNADDAAEDTPPMPMSAAAVNPPDREVFGRQVRRALSAAGDLPRLAASPLAALVPPAGSGSPAERAQRLRGAMVQSIERLRPQTAADEVTAPAWRHYHVLHLPYVRGVRISSREALAPSLGEFDRAAAEWLRRDVPERTFFRWQSAASALVADDLWARWWPEDDAAQSQ